MRMARFMPRAAGTAAAARARRRNTDAAITSCHRWRDEFQLFNLFRYLTFRTGGAMMTDGDHLF